MFTTLKPGESRAIVGIQFNDQTEDFITSVREFAEATKFKLSLVHVWKPEDHILPLSLAPSVNFHSALFELERYDLESKMEKLVEKFPGLDVETEVFSGDPATTLKIEADKKDAALIIIGARESSYRGMPRAFSTALELGSSSRVSTMIIPPGTVNHWNNIPWKILVADDFDRHSWPALHLASDLCLHSNSFEFHYFHAHRVGKQILRRSAQKILEAMTLGKIPYNEEFGPEFYMSKVQSQLQGSMKERMGALQGILKSTGGRYHEHILYGPVKDCMDDVVMEVDPHLIVLGRHEAIHQRPFALGQLPLHTMLKAEVPIIIAV